MSQLRYAYYPGCSGLGTSAEYDSSTRAMCDLLGIELVDIPDWNCCGSTPAHAVDQLLSASLVARNFALAEKLADKMEINGIITPCPSCLKNLKNAQHHMHESDEFHKEVETILGHSVRADLPIKSVLQVVQEDIGTETMKQRSTAPLKGLKVVPYYGCLMTRPPKTMQFDDPENPMALDHMLKSMGADVLPFALKVDCCGASLGTTRKEVVTRLAGRILDAAAEAGADAIVTACPLCQMNLDMRQGQVNRANNSNHNIPVFYYSQLAGLASGLRDERIGLNKLCVSPHALLGSLRKRAEEVQS